MAVQDWKTTQLIGYSWRVVREDKVFLMFPLAAGAAMLLVALLAAGALYELGFWERMAGREEGSGFWGILEASSTLDLVLIASAYVFTGFTSVYCNATMFATAWQRLDGERPSLRATIRQANGVLPELIGWSCLLSSIGIVTQLSLRSRETFTQIPGLVLAIVWSFATFFVVPFIVLENLSPYQAMKRSTHLLQKTWGKQLKACVGFGLAYFGLLLPFCFPIAGAMIWPWFGVSLGLLYLPFFFAGYVVLLAMDGFFSAALFRFATTGDVSRDYPENFIRGAYKGKMEPAPLPPLPRRPRADQWSSATWPLEAPDAGWPARPSRASAGLDLRRM